MNYLWNLLGYSSNQSQRLYNWSPDKKDSRDLNHLFYSNAKLPTQVDLRTQCPPVYNQGTLGSCTANAIAGAYEFDEMKQNEPTPFIPSRLFIYYNERSKEHHIEHDAGAELRDGIKSIYKQGVCHETSWPYDISKFTQKPPTECYEEAKHHKAVLYRRVLQIENQFKQCLNQGYPFVMGIAIFESFETAEVAKTGQVPLPKTDEKMLGGHAVLCVGYDDEKKVYIVRNSWGTEWGDEGYFYLPYDYIHDHNLASDFWTVIKIQDTESEADKADRELELLIASLSEPSLETVTPPELPDVPKTPELPEPIAFTDLPPLPPSPELELDDEENP
jgi:C1A family cysteine protease